jgi:hypothetical protein
MPLTLDPDARGDGDGRGDGAPPGGASAMDFIRHTRPGFPAGLEVRARAMDDASAPNGMLRHH